MIGESLACYWVINDYLCRIGLGLSIGRWASSHHPLTFFYGISGRTRIYGRLYCRGGLVRGLLTQLRVSSQKVCGVH